MIKKIVMTTATVAIVGLLTLPLFSTAGSSNTDNNPMHSAVGCIWKFC